MRDHQVMEIQDEQDQQGAERHESRQRGLHLEAVDIRAQHAAIADRHTDAGDDEFQRENIEPREQSEERCR
jgi:hypothetical protein